LQKYYLQREYRKIRASVFEMVMGATLNRNKKKGPENQILIFRAFLKK